MPTLRRGLFDVLADCVGISGCIPLAPRLSSRLRAAMRSSCAILLTSGESRQCSSSSVLSSRDNKSILATTAGLLIDCSAPLAVPASEGETLILVPWELFMDTVASCSEEGWSILRTVGQTALSDVAGLPELLLLTLCFSRPGMLSLPGRAGIRVGGELWRWLARLLRRAATKPLGTGMGEQADADGPSLGASEGRRSLSLRGGGL